MVEVLSRSNRRLRFSVLLITILATGVGLNTALFSAIEKVLLRPLPYPGSDRLVRLSPEAQVNKMMVQRADSLPTFSGVAAYVESRFAVSGLSGPPELVQGARVSHKFFDVLGLNVRSGRGFSPEDAAEGAPRVVVVGETFWRTRMAEDPTAVGKTIRIDGEPYVVVGVFSSSSSTFDRRWRLWLPITMDSANEEDLLSSYYLSALARLAPGITQVHAEEAVKAAWTQLHETYPQRITEEKLAEAGHLILMHDWLVGNARIRLLILQAGAGILLLVVSFNVSILLLAQTASRLREFAIRSALGAGRSEIVAVLLREVLLFGLLGGVGGGLIAKATSILLEPQMQDSLVWASSVEIFEWRVLLLNFGLSFLGVILASVVPILRLTREGNITLHLKDQGTGEGVGRRGRRLVQLLVLMQVIASTVLLAFSAVVLQGLWRLTRIGAPLDLDVLTLRLDLPEVLYPEASQKTAYYDEVLAQLGSLPGVSSAGAIHLLPLTEGNWSFPYLAEGHSIPVNSGMVALPTTNFRVTTPDYFKAAGITILDGREFQRTDEAQGPAVGIINRKLADELWPGKSAVGREIQLFGSEGPKFKVVGVVEAVRQHRLDEEPQPEIYRPFTQWPIGSMYVVIRGHGSPDVLLRSVRARVWSIDPQVPISEQRTVREVVASSVADRRQAGVLLLLFAVVSLVLSVSGVYGLMAQAVNHRVREIGVRMALGSRKVDIIGLVVSQGVQVTLIGLGIGSLLSWWLVSLPQVKLLQVQANKLLDFLAVGMIVLVATLLSSLIPAWRAVRIDPMEALRSD